MSSEQERQSPPEQQRKRTAAPAGPSAAPAAAAETAAPAAAPSAEPRLLTDPIAMRALAHPVRTALFELLYVLDTLTATQASELLGESPANCAFHLRTLAKYGFAEEAGGGRGRERPWKATDLHISISTEQDDRQAALAAGVLGNLWLEQWIQRAREVYGSNTTLPGWERATGWSRSAVFLTPEETRELSRQIYQLIRQYEPRKTEPSLRPPGALPVEWAVFEAPIAELAELFESQAGEGAAGQAAEERGGRRAGRGRRVGGQAPDRPDENV